MDVNIWYITINTKFLGIILMGFLNLDLSTVNYNEHDIT